MEKYKKTLIVIAVFAAFLVFLNPTPRVSAQSCQSKSQGDANCDGSVNLADFEVWLQEFTGILSSVTSDFDENSSVTLIDFEIWRRSYYSNITPTGKGFSPPIEDPTPTVIIPTPTIQNPSPTIKTPTPTVKYATPTLKDQRDDGDDDRDDDDRDDD